eukprot:13566935-Ditylum_brightwellii.AAC.1
MACFVYHTKSCPCGGLIVVLTHSERSLSLTKVQVVIVASRFIFAAIGRRDCLPSCKSSLFSPFKKEVQ